MKYFKLFILLFLVSSCTQKETETTTYYLIRHAEKDRTDKTNKNPDLNNKGLERAKKWSEILKNVEFDMIYSTNYNRTQQTAKPTADSNNLEVLSYNPNDMYNLKFQKETIGKTVLIVGHSNTTPFFVNKILEKEKHQQIDDRNNANLYIVNVQNGIKTDILLKIE
ncbi:histidine phosphatase family protein [Tenacibaculum sp. S7007]|uniref:Histidine phosphatase family protein n=1 Tax=Tenacibaculum pelagium TaxID=2759527 RepID=A0A839AJ28_9FLAO|nr:histidine phosphatase family protein [Tenacibaculum pelagium]MBA6155103.1 histidine phosphatase family protein [Tenacibaculum pelagium]